VINEAQDAEAQALELTERDALLAFRMHDSRNAQCAIDLQTPSAEDEIRFDHVRIPFDKSPIRVWAKGAPWRDDVPPEQSRNRLPKALLLGNIELWVRHTEIGLEA
jgi:hypothetical protein